MRAFCRQEFFDRGKFKNVRRLLAKALGLDESNVAKTLRLRLLSPKIVHHIVTGDIPRNLTINALRRSVSDVRSEQEKQVWGSEDALNV